MGLTLDSAPSPLPGKVSAAPRGSLGPGVPPPSPGPCGGPEPSCGPCLTDPPLTSSRALQVLPPRLPRPCLPAVQAPREAGAVGGRRLRGLAQPRALRAGKGASPRKDPRGVSNMATSSRAEVLRLYRALLRESQRFSGYNYRCAPGPGGEGLRDRQRSQHRFSP